MHCSRRLRQLLLACKTLLQPPRRRGELVDVPGGATW